MTKTDLVWDEIYQRYMTSRLTYRQLADQYGVSFSVLCRKGAREHWPQQRRQALRDCANRYTPLCQHEAIIAKKEKSVSQEEDFENQLTAPDKKKIRDLSGKDKQIEETSGQKTDRMPAETEHENSVGLSSRPARSGTSSNRRAVAPALKDARGVPVSHTERTVQNGKTGGSAQTLDWREGVLSLSSAEAAPRPDIGQIVRSSRVGGRKRTGKPEQGRASSKNSCPSGILQTETTEVRVQNTGAYETLSNGKKLGQILNPEPVKGDLNRESAEQLSKMGKIGQTLSAEAAKEDLNGEDAGLFSKTEKPEPFLNCGAAEKRSKDEGAQPFSTTGEMEPFTNASQTEQPKLFSEQTLSGLRDLLVQQVHTAFLQLGRRAITEKIHVGVVREPAAPGRSGNSRRKADEASTAFSDAAEQAARQGEALGLEESAAGTAKWKCTYTKDTENIRYVPDDIDVARLKQLSAILRDLYALSDTDNGQKIEVVFAPDTEAWSE